MGNWIILVTSLVLINLSIGAVIREDVEHLTVEQKAVQALDAILKIMENLTEEKVAEQMVKSEEKLSGGSVNETFDFTRVETLEEPENVSSSENSDKTSKDLSSQTSHPVENNSSETSVATEANQNVTGNSADETKEITTTPKPSKTEVHTTTNPSTAEPPQDPKQHPKNVVIVKEEPIVSTSEQTSEVQTTTEGSSSTENTPIPKTEFHPKNVVFSKGESNVPASTSTLVPLNVLPISTTTTSIETSNITTAIPVITVSEVVMEEAEEMAAVSEIFLNETTTATSTAARTTTPKPTKKGFLNRVKTFFTGRIFRTSNSVPTK